jgi:hypothetical protein
MNPRWLLALPVVVGVVFLAVGITLFTDDGPARELQRVEALSRLTRGPLEPVGQPALVQGRISATSPAVYRTFVACSRALFDGYEDEPLSATQSRSQPTTPQRVERWKPRDVLAPPLTLELEDGPVQLSGSYRLGNPTHHERDPVADSIFGKTPEAVDGFFVGDLVTAEGRLGPGRTLVTIAVEGGDVATFIASRKMAVTSGHVLGLVFMPLGGIILLGCALVLRRLWRSPRR